MADPTSNSSSPNNNTSPNAATPALTPQYPQITPSSNASPPPQVPKAPPPGSSHSFLKEFGIFASICALSFLALILSNLLPILRYPFSLLMGQETFQIVLFSFLGLFIGMLGPIPILIFAFIFSVNGFLAIKLRKLWPLHLVIWILAGIYINYRLFITLNTPCISFGCISKSFGQVVTMSFWATTVGLASIFLNNLNLNSKKIKAFVCLLIFIIGFAVMMYINSTTPEFKKTEQESAQLREKDATTKSTLKTFGTYYEPSYLSPKVKATDIQASDSEGITIGYLCNNLGNLWLYEKVADKSTSSYFANKESITQYFNKNKTSSKNILVEEIKINNSPGYFIDDDRFKNVLFQFKPPNDKREFEIRIQAIYMCEDDFKDVKSELIKMAESMKPKTP